jgi:hypothetical protein
MKRKIEDSNSDVLVKDPKISLDSSPGRVLHSTSTSSSAASSFPISYKVAGETYDVHVTNQFEVDKATIAWFAKLNDSIAKVSNHFDTRVKAVVGLDCEWSPVSLKPVAPFTFIVFLQ